MAAYELGFLHWVTHYKTTGQMNSLLPLERDLCTALAHQAQTHVRTGRACPRKARAAALDLLNACNTADRYLDALEHLRSMLPPGDEYPLALDFVEDALCEAADLEIGPEGAVLGHLAVLPVLVTGSVNAWDDAPGEDFFEHLPRLLARHRVVVDARAVTPLPLLVGAQEAGAMTHVEVYQLRQLLAAGRVAEARAFVQGVRVALFGEQRTDGATCQESSALALLVAYVRTECVDPFELARQLGRDEAHPEFAQAESELTALAASLETLNPAWTRVAAAEAADWWYTATASAQQLDRLLYAQSTLSRLGAQAELELGEVLVGHEVAESGPLSPPGYEMTLTRSRDNAFLGKLTWPVLRAEWADDALEAFYAFLADSGVLPVEVLQSESDGADEPRH